jgi:hypothetical protein
MTLYPRHWESQEPDYQEKQWERWWIPDPSDLDDYPAVDHEQFRARLVALGWRHVAAVTPRLSWFNRLVGRIQTRMR